MGRETDHVRALLSIASSIVSTPGTVAVVGSINADVTTVVAEFPSPGETVVGGDVTISPGGKSSNQAVAASKMGAHVAMVGAVGRDPYGERLRGELATVGVDTSHVVERDTPTGTALITVNRAGENTIVYSAGANRTVSRGDIEAAAGTLQGSDVVALGFEAPVSAVEAAINVARHADRAPQIIVNYSPIVDAGPGVLQGADIVIVNQLELRALAAAYGVLDEDGGALLPDHDNSGGEDSHGLTRPGEGPPDGLESIARRIACCAGLRGVIVTVGSAGCVVIELDEVCGLSVSSVGRACQGVYSPGWPVDTVDSTGCGDCFMGTVAAAVAAGCGLVDAARWATFVASRAATRRGAQRSYFSAEHLVCELSSDADEAL